MKINHFVVLKNVAFINVHQIYIIHAVAMLHEYLQYDFSKTARKKSMNTFRETKHVSEKNTLNPEFLI